MHNDRIILFSPFFILISFLLIFSLSFSSFATVIQPVLNPNEVINWLNYSSITYLYGKDSDDTTYQQHAYTNEFVSSNGQYFWQGHTTESITMNSLVSLYTCFLLPDVSFTSGYYLQIYMNFQLSNNIYPINQLINLTDGDYSVDLVQLKYNSSGSYTSASVAMANVGSFTVSSSGDFIALKVDCIIDDDYTSSNSYLNRYNYGLRVIFNGLADENNSTEQYLAFRYVVLDNSYYNYSDTSINVQEPSETDIPSYEESKYNPVNKRPINDVISAESSLIDSASDNPNSFENIISFGTNFINTFASGVTIVGSILNIAIGANGLTWLTGLLWFSLGVGLIAFILGISLMFISRRRE